MFNFGIEDIGEVTEDCGDSLCCTCGSTRLKMAGQGWTRYRSHRDFAPCFIRLFLGDPPSRVWAAWGRWLSGQPVVI